MVGNEPVKTATSSGATAARQFTEMRASHDADTGPLEPQIRGPESLAELVKTEIERAEREKRNQRDRRHEERASVSERNREAMEAQRNADTDDARRRVEEARARAAKAASHVSDRTGKRRRKATPAEPTGPTFATATTLDELIQASVPDGARLTPPPWRELIRWWGDQDALNKTLTEAMREALCEALGEHTLLLPWTEAGGKGAEDLRAMVPGTDRLVDMLEYNQRWLALPEPRPSHVVAILVDAWLRGQPIDRDHDVGRLDRVPGQTARVEVTLRELVAWLWPNGWKRTRRGDRLGDLQILQRELLILDVSAPAWRAYLRLAYLWDAAKGRNNGARIYATRPVVARDRRGVLLGTDGKALRDQRGAVVKDWSDPRAVILGADGKPASASNPPAYERNPAADRVPVLGPDNLIRLAFDDSEVTRGTFRKRLHDARQALATMAATGAVILESDHYGGVRVLEQRRGHAVTLRGTRGNARRCKSCNNRARAFSPNAPSLHSR